MKIYIVTSGDYDDYEIVGVFSSLEKARNFLNKSELDALVSQAGDLTVVGIAERGYWLWGQKWGYRIEGYEVDTLPSLKWRSRTNTATDGEKVLQVGTRKGFRE